MSATVSALYRQETKRFGYGVVAVLPLLALYEWGITHGALGRSLNGADALLRTALAFVAAFFGLQYGTWLVAGVVGALAVGFLVYLKRQRLRIAWPYVLGMYLEAAVMGVGLAVLTHLMLSRTLPQFFTFVPNPGVVQQLAIQGLSAPWTKVVAAVGAGVFEELLFRVLLLTALYRLWAKTNRPLGHDKTAAIRATLLSSVVFAALHLGSINASGLLSVFTSSVFLSWLYLARGYGMAALSHTAYDLYLMFGVVA